MSSVEPQNTLGLLDLPTNDPPPPYPSPERRSRTLRTSRRHAQRAALHIPTRTTLDPDAAEQALHPHFPPSETTPLLRPSRRRRANSHASTIVSSSSFTQTVLSFCQDSESESDVQMQRNEHQDLVGRGGTQVPGRWSRRKRAWARYFRPMGRKAYYAAVFHLLVLNFPFALVAWIYLFVFTLVSGQRLGSGQLGGTRWWLMPRILDWHDASDHVASGGTAVLP